MNGMVYRNETPAGQVGHAAGASGTAKPHIFGIRHLSPAGAWHLRRFLDEKNPKLVLIEGPVDFNDQMEHLVHPDTRPPFAILAYTADVPVRTILYPFARYSPEYQAVLWCHEHGKISRFMDLPSSVFLALGGNASPNVETADEGQFPTDANASPNDDASASGTQRASDTSSNDDANGQGGRNQANASSNDDSDGQGGRSQANESPNDDSDGRGGRNQTNASSNDDADDSANADRNPVGTAAFNVYQALDRQTGEDGHETFWERSMEQTLDTAAYHEAANLFGSEIRSLSLDFEKGRQADAAENFLREAFMRLQIRKAIEEGFAPEEIVVVTGAYHVAGLMAQEAGAGTPAASGEADRLQGRPGDAVGLSGDAQGRPDGEGGRPDGGRPDGASWAAVGGNYGAGGVRTMTEAEAAKLPKAAASHTLMPYSDFRLSTRSGYGAGNKAPAYYQLLWENFVYGDLTYSARSYLSRIAIWQREHGNPVSSAAVIEAVRMAESLAQLRGSRYPALRDLRDAAVTCLGEGRFSNISLAVADTEIGTAIGSLPEGVSRTSIQEDFHRQLKQLKLEKYYDITAQDLYLDLRENRRVASEKSAFLDRNRSFFLHQVRVLCIRFAKAQNRRQDSGTWAEHWILQWTPEAEIELVESALKGDTVAQAASFAMKERVEGAGSMAEIAAVIEDGFTCGMAETVRYATAVLQAMAVDGAAVEELADTCDRLSSVLQYGSIRNLDPRPLKPILQQMFYRACLILSGACVCDDAASKAMTAAMEQLNRAALAHDFLNQEAWIHALEGTAARDDLNTKLSGYAAAILLERGKVDSDWLRTEVSRRLSRGVPADLGAGWFEGLAMKNRYGLIARLSLWESLDQYLETLTDDEFKRALVFLRRAFADFSAAEKDAIAENLGEIWGVDAQQASEMLNADVGEEVQELVESLDDFDFDF